MNYQQKTKIVLNKLTSRLLHLNNIKKDKQTALLR